MNFKDHFSAQADRYSRYRPGYPDALFAYLAGLVPERTRAWDCGTGNGQAAIKLAAHFDEVLATDASARQIAHAVPHPNVRYSVAPAEASGIDAGTVVLTVVAQALHWFAFDRFYAEVRRVSAPGAYLAVVWYGVMTISPSVDAVVRRFNAETVGPYWPPERRYFNEGYRRIPFPFEELETPGFEAEAEWNLDDVVGYMGTWSATQRYREAHGEDPVANVKPELEAAWGRPEEARRVHRTFGVRVGRVE